MGVLGGNPQQEPLHCGEVFDIYSFLAVAQAGVAAYQVFINHTGDDDLRSFLQDKVENLIRPQIQELSEILKLNGIALPPAPPERPNADVESIPAGARINDAEIAVNVAKDISLGLVACSQAIGKATREDIAMMFGKFHMEIAQYGAKLLRMMKKKGWLVPPPLFANTMIEAK
jgi:spore coat protein CotF